MPKIEWDDTFIVGVEEIDEQHKRWIEIINELHDSIMGRDISTKTTSRILGEMIDYANFHFAFEEDYMEKINYADLKKHHYQHDFFRKNLVAKLQEQQAGGLLRNSDVMRILMSWLQKHILEEDKKLCA